MQPKGVDALLAHLTPHISETAKGWYLHPAPAPRRIFAPARPIGPPHAGRHGPPRATSVAAATPGIGNSDAPYPPQVYLYFRPQNAKSPTAMAGLSARNVKQNFGRSAACIFWKKIQHYLLLFDAD